MGTLVYGSAPTINVEDRTLRHLQAVMIAKLRRHENFAFNWDQEPGVSGDAEHDRGSHGAIWISPSSQLYFRFDGPRKNLQLNRQWLDVMMQATYSGEGLSALPEPSDS